MDSAPLLNYAPRAPHLRRSTILGAIAAALLASVLPIWDVWYIGPWEATGESGTLVTAIRMLPYNVEEAGVRYVLQLQSGNVVKLPILLLIGGVIGRVICVFRAGRPTRP